MEVRAGNIAVGVKRNSTGRCGTRCLAAARARFPPSSSGIARWLLISLMLLLACFDDNWRALLKSAQDDTELAGTAREHARSVGAQLSSACSTRLQRLRGFVDQVSQLFLQLFIGFILFILFLFFF